MSIIRNRIDRIKNGTDLGIDRDGQQGRQRTINADGSFNLKRISDERVDFELYHWLINTTWTRYWLTVFLFYGTLNFLFAVIFYQIGPQYIVGISPDDSMNDFIQCFFFSNQTFTTVGYGGMHPSGLASSWVASLEAFIGLMSFALATGTLYGRFSKPTSRIVYGKQAVIAPYQEFKAFQFIIANGRTSNLMELEATVNCGYIDNTLADPVRQFKQLTLQLNRIAMFPTSWTLNHVIDEDSVFYGLSHQDMIDREIEVFILIKGFDETFSQIIYSRSSYTASDIVWGAKFNRPFSIGEDGKLVMDLRTLGSHYPIELPA
jgi:inward rectifier potassium channel